MLRRQPPHTGPLDFLVGDSEMAERIRAFDWTGHPFGLPESWPQSLRSALSICLHSAFPTAIYWGPELRLLYNDAWAPIPGPRHPAALGAPAREVWGDIWHVIRPQFERLIETGQGLFLQDEMLPMQRFGLPEETYWSYSFTPIRGEDGAIVGVFNCGFETTSSVLNQRRMRFLLELGEALRASTDQHDACARSLSRLGGYLDVQRVGLCEAYGNGFDLEITEQWTAADTEPLDRVVDLSRVGTLLHATLRKGRILRIDDVRTDPRTAGEGMREAFARVDVAAALAVPWTRSGELVATLFLHAARPRHWSDADVTTAEQVLERTWRWVERERAMQRERIMVREIDHRARNALAVVQSLVRQTRATNVVEFRAQVDDRIAALARAHSLLSARRWSEVDLAALVEQEVAPYLAVDTPRVEVSGPPVHLTPELAQSLALVLHELTTNAVKHGALSIDAGALRVSWYVEASGDLVLEWLESGPERRTPRSASSRRGFGSVLFDAVIDKQLRGRIERRFQNGWLICELRMALGERPPPPVSTGPAAAEAERRASTRKRILIAEDEAIVALDVASMVEALGYEPDAICHTVEDGLAALEASLPDLALLDANLAGRSSVPIAEKLHARGVPVIFTTGYEQLPDLPAPLRDLPLLSKPIAEAGLARAIAEALEESLPA